MRLSPTNQYLNQSIRLKSRAVMRLKQMNNSSCMTPNNNNPKGLLFGQSPRATTTMMKTAYESAFIPAVD